MATDRRPTPSASSSSSSSAPRDPLHASLTVDDDRRATSIADVSVTLDPRPDDVSPIPLTSSPLVDDLCGLPPSSPQKQDDPSSLVVISPLRSLLSGTAAAAEQKSPATLRTGDGNDDSAACRQPLSSGWATALAAATIAGKAAAASATKRRPNAAKQGGASFNIRASRSLFCLTTSNPIRKLSISVVEWKYPFCSSSFTNLFTVTHDGTHAW